MSEKNECLRNGSVVWGNDFKNKEEVFELFCGKKMEDGFLGRKGWLKLNDEKKVVVLLKGNPKKRGWCDYLEDGDRIDSRGWSEKVAFESCQETNPEESEKFWELCLGTDLNEYEFYVFVKMERLGVKWYKFAGVFEFDRRSTDLCGGQPLSGAWASWWDGRVRTFFGRKDETGPLEWLSNSGD